MTAKKRAKKATRAPSKAPERGPSEAIDPKPDGVFVDGEQVGPETQEPTPREEVSDGVSEA